MDPATLSLALTIIRQAPALIDFVEHTAALFSAGTITEDEMKALWSQAGTAFVSAKAAWDAAKPPAPAAA